MVDVSSMYPRQMMGDIFYVIKFKGKQLFIKEGKSIKSFRWTDDLQDAIWFESEEQAITTAKNYFIYKFKNYEVRPIGMNSSLVGYLINEGETNANV